MINIDGIYVFICWSIVAKIRWLILTMNTMKRICVPLGPGLEYWSIPVWPCHMSSSVVLDHEIIAVWMRFSTMAHMIIIPIVIHCTISNRTILIILDYHHCTYSFMIISGLKSMILLSKIWKPPDIREAPVAMTPWYRGFKGNVREPKHRWEEKC